ncbi:MAG: TetR/AcrR family transcriptional regulator [Firmicutes bacterium]|nr:TetR/AcrR family transcriptional regulator [Bacillota bacterium]
MVKQGFLNLSDAEQHRIIDAALDEFAEKDYEAASLNNIIARAGISKGSMYHYFANKEDLYFYLINRVLEAKEIFLKKALTELSKPLAEMNFFENLEFQMLASVDFAMQHYREHQLSVRLQNMAEGPLKERLFGDLNRAFEDYVKNMVDAAMQAGEIRDDFDRDFVIRILKFTLMHFIDIYPDFEKFMADDSRALKAEALKLSAFLKKGLQKYSEENL